ncbi:hypothetical protein GA0115246_103781 [Streptomyces sp. SolWspMP-sol7th]|nr:hypothetical protein GA0115246_103781 [Streptomyces sp. SolWspMP-sol7th]
MYGAGATLARTAFAPVAARIRRLTPTRLARAGSPSLEGDASLVGGRGTTRLLPKASAEPGRTEAALTRGQRPPHVKAGPRWHQAAGARTGPRGLGPPHTYPNSYSLASALASRRPSRRPRLPATPPSSPSPPLVKSRAAAAGRAREMRAVPETRAVREAPFTSRTGPPSAGMRTAVSPGPLRHSQRADPRPTNKAAGTGRVESARPGARCHVRSVRRRGRSRGRRQGRTEARPQPGAPAHRPPATAHRPRRRPPIRQSPSQGHNDRRPSPANAAAPPAP